jgi:hypothetical protein
VADGLLVEESAARMAVKNALIVAALRDHTDYDSELVARVARGQLLHLARENERTADRLVEARGDSEKEWADAQFDEHDAQRLENQLRRPTVHRLLAEALRAEAEDPEAVEALVARARSDAAQELGRAVVGRLRASDFAADPDYEAERESRIRQLVDLDLAPMRLASERES